MPKAEKDYTVVGLYADNKQVLVEWVTAEDPKKAAAKGRRKMSRFGGGVVLCVFDGHKVDRYGQDELYRE